MEEGTCDSSACKRHRQRRGALPRATSLLLNLVCTLALPLVLRSGLRGSWWPRFHWWQQDHQTAFAYSSIRGGKVSRWKLHKGDTPYNEFQRKRISDANHMGGIIQLPNDAPSLCPKGANIAVKDNNQLASEPLKLQIDRHGKNILEGEQVQSSIPWSLNDVHGISAAEAPSCFEEFAARYRDIDARSKGIRVASPLDDGSLDTLKKAILKEDGRDDYRTIRTFAWPGDDPSKPSTVMLIGVTEFSARSRQLAARAVYEAEPTALVLQLNKEQVGRQLVMPAEHRSAAANYQRGYISTNPLGERHFWHATKTIDNDYKVMVEWSGGLAYYAAWDEFLQLPEQDTMPKVLCLGDVSPSKLEELVRQKGKKALTAVPTLSARGKQITRGIAASASAGHKVVLGIVDVDLLGPVTTWLERAGARLVAVADASDIDAGRESIADDVQLGLAADLTDREMRPVQASEVLGFGRLRLGAFLNERGMQLLDSRRQRLAKTTRLKDLVRHREPKKKWETVDLLMGTEEIPGPEALVVPENGLQFEGGLLEVPEHYVREAGMGKFHSSLWELLLRRGGALETEDVVKLEWWLAGATESEAEPSVLETPFLESAWADSWSEQR